jgi:hypothetical protein
MRMRERQGRAKEGTGGSVCTATVAAIAIAAAAAATFSIYFAPHLADDGLLGRLQLFGADQQAGARLLEQPLEPVQLLALLAGGGGRELLLEVRDLGPMGGRRIRREEDGGGEEG